MSKRAREPAAVAASADGVLARAPIVDAVIHEVPVSSDEEDAAEAPASEVEDESPKKKRKPTAASRKKNNLKAAAAATAVDVEEEEDDAEEDAADDAASSSSATPAAAVDLSSFPRANREILSFPDEVLAQPIESYSAAFDAIAKELLLNHDLVSNGVRLRLLEIEFYWKGDAKPAGQHAHHDTFAHGHPNQLNNYGKWYFHRQGQKPTASFKGGSYKGMDVTFGPKSGGGYGGVLIRSIQRVDNGTVIEGSCLCAEEVLRNHGVDSLITLHDKWKSDTNAFTGPTLFFTPREKKDVRKAGQPLMIKSARVGLTLKVEGPDRPKFILQPYRYTMLRDGVFNKKMKQTIVLSAYEDLGGNAAAKPALQKLCGVTPAYLNKILPPYEKGKKLGSMEKFLKNNKKALSTEDMCELLGAWMVEYGPKPYKAILRAE